MIAGKVIGALGENPSPYILTLVVFLLCCIMTNFMSNTATTALMVPICLSIAQGMGADPRAVLMACVIGGSCAYVTPIGMPANTMVVGAGGYKFMDYVKAGFPLIVIATIVSMVILPIRVNYWAIIFVNNSFVLPSFLRLGKKREWTQMRSFSNMLQIPAK